MKKLAALVLALAAAHANATTLNPSSVGDFLQLCGKASIVKNTESCLHYILGLRMGFAASQRHNLACADATLARPPLAILGVLQEADLPPAMPMVEATMLVMRAERNCRVDPSQRAPV